jgi:hypothetical protein
MEPSIISIKVRGANAIQALHENLHMLGGAKAQGAAVVGKTAVATKSAAVKQGAAVGKTTVVKVAELGGGAPGLFAHAAEVEGGRTLTAAKGTLMRGVEVEGGRIAATSKGLTLRAAEVEAGRALPWLGKAELEGTRMAITTGKGATAKGLATASGTAAKAAAGSGTIWSGTGLSLGLGMGLGALGPFLLLTSLGLVATGIYMYRRNRALDTDLPLDDAVM